MDRETKSLDISVAFPQATPASIFPPSGKYEYFHSMLIICMFKVLYKQLHISSLQNLKNLTTYSNLLDKPFKKFVQIQKRVQEFTWFKTYFSSQDDFFFWEPRTHSLYPKHIHILARMVFITQQNDHIS